MGQLNSNRAVPSVFPFMGTLSHTRALYLDVEQQCWGGDEKPEGFHHDIIQIGLVEADLQNLYITRHEGFIVRPAKINISAFCTELTGITEEQVRRAARFSERISTIVRAYGPGSKLCFTWGDDARDIANACLDSQIRDPFNFCNLAWLYRCSFGIKRNVGLVNALKSFGLEFEGRQHDAMWDAYNTARVHMAMIERLRQAGPLFLPENSESTTPDGITHHGEVC